MNFIKTRLEFHLMIRRWIVFNLANVSHQLPPRFMAKLLRAETERRQKIFFVFSQYPGLINIHVSLNGSSC